MERIDASLFKPIKDEKRGFTTKYWIYDKKSKLIKFNNELYKDQDVMEKLSSDILKTLEVDTVNVNLGIVGDKKCCIVDSFLDSGDILYEVDHFWAIRETGNVEEDIGMALSKVIYIFSSLYDISKEELDEIKRSYIRMIFADCIIGNEDRKLKNVALIFNENSLKYRLSPSFDNALSFNAYTMINTEPVAYIGNQYFNSADIINYLQKYYLDIVNPISEKLNNLVANDLISLLNKYDEIEYKKVSYIITELKRINDLINNLDEKRIK